MLMTEVYSRLVDALRLTLKTKAKPRVSNLGSQASLEANQAFCTYTHKTIGFTVPSTVRLEGWLVDYAIKHQSLVITNNLVRKQQLLKLGFLKGLEDTQVLTFRELLEGIRLGDTHVLTQYPHWVLYRVNQYQGKEKDLVNSWYYQHQDWKPIENHLLVIHPY